jgi:hypothetical protein
MDLAQTTHEQIDLVHTIVGLGQRRDHGSVGVDEREL